MTSSTRLIRSAAVTLILGSLLSAGRADDWPFFRGPDMNGVSSETGWQAVWTGDGPTIAWRKDLSPGASSFTVSGENVLTMGNVNDQDHVYCLNPENGDERWVFKYACPLNKRQFEGGPAATPTIDGDRVYTLSWAGDLYCLSLKTGKVIWSKHLVDDFGAQPPRWKYSGSPLVAGALLILDAGGKGVSTLALDKLTGRKRWANGDDTAGYATPIPFGNALNGGVLVFKAKHLVAYRLRDGRELWRFPWETAYDVNASSPLVIGETLFVSSGYAKGKGAMFQLTSTTPRELWVNDDIKTKMSTCVPHKGYIYGISEKGGVLLCIERTTGQIAWKERGFGNYGTLIMVDGKIVALTESGTLVVAEADGGAYKELSRAQVLDGRCWVNPVLANGRIYCKTNNGKMACVDVR